MKKDIDNNIDEKRIKAYRLYTENRKRIEEIAKELGCSISTIYRYKQEDKENDIDWDADRNLLSLSPDEIKNRLFSSIAKILIETQKTKKPIDSKQADALSKLYGIVKKVYPKDIVFGVIIDVLKIISEDMEIYKKLDPDFYKKFKDRLPSIQEKIEKSYALVFEE